MIDWADSGGIAVGARTKTRATCVQVGESSDVGQAVPDGRGIRLSVLDCSRRQSGIASPEDVPSGTA